jgi:hypothetical protein
MREISEINFYRLILLAFKNHSLSYHNRLHRKNTKLLRVLQSFATQPADGLVRLAQRHSFRQQ